MDIRASSSGARMLAPRIAPPTPYLLPRGYVRGAGKADPTGIFKRLMAVVAGTTLAKVPAVRTRGRVKKLPFLTHD